MFGYFSSTQFFGDMTNINLKDMIFNQKMKEIEDDMVPFGHIDDGTEHIQQIDWREKARQNWAVEYDPELAME